MKKLLPLVFLAGIGVISLPATAARSHASAIQSSSTALRKPMLFDIPRFRRRRRVITIKPNRRQRRAAARRANK